MVLPMALAGCSAWESFKYVVGQVAERVALLQTWKLINPHPIKASPGSVGSKQPVDFRVSIRTTLASNTHTAIVQNGA